MRAASGRWTRGGRVTCRCRSSSSTRTPCCICTSPMECSSQPQRCVPCPALPCRLLSPASARVFTISLLFHTRTHPLSAPFSLHMIYMSRTDSTCRASRVRITVHECAIIVIRCFRLASSHRVFGKTCGAFGSFRTPSSVSAAFRGCARWHL